MSPEYARHLESYGGYLYKQLAPASDPFGIAILSRLPLTGAKISTDMDGIHHMSALLNWNGQPVTLITWHPMPPLSPRYHQSRNTRLRAIAEAVRRDSHPAVLAGDLNATPWSNAFHGIDQMGLRRVTGLLPTWPAAGLGWMGIPIDHVLVSAHWTVVEVSRGPDLGSDHLPVVARIALARSESQPPTTPKLDHSVLERPLKRLQAPVHIYYPLAVLPDAEESSFHVQLQLLMDRKRKLAQNLLAAPAFTRDDYEQLLAGSLREVKAPEVDRSPTPAIF